MEQFFNFATDLNWRIIAVVIVGLLAWRRDELARLVKRVWGVNAKAAEVPAADPVDLLVARVNERRLLIAVELRDLNSRIDELAKQLERLDSLFAKPTTSDVPGEGAT